MAASCLSLASEGHGIDWQVVFMVGHYTYHIDELLKSNSKLHVHRVRLVPDRPLQLAVVAVEQVVQNLSLVPALMTPLNKMSAQKQAESFCKSFWFNLTRLFSVEQTDRMVEWTGQGDLDMSCR